MITIQPTIGRIVWVKKANIDEMPAIIVKVWTDTCINVTAFPDDDGYTRYTSILYNDEPTEDTASITWRWMPYQLAQAVKHQSPTAHELAEDFNKINGIHIGKYGDGTT